MGKGKERRTEKVMGEEEEKDRGKQDHHNFRNLFISVKI